MTTGTKLNFDLFESYCTGVLFLSEQTHDYLPVLTSFIVKVMSNNSHINWWACWLLWYLA